MQRSNNWYLCDGMEICAKRYRDGKDEFIIFIDCETDGLLFSHTIPLNYSFKNIETFLNSKFRSITKL